MTTPAPTVISMAAADSDDLPPPSVAESAKTEDSTNGRSNGKIARLSKTIRVQINHWLEDGVSYPEIIRRLGDDGKGLTPNNVSQWKKRGHKDWLLHQDWLAERRARQESAADLIHDSDVTEVNQGALVPEGSNPAATCGNTRDQRPTYRPFGVLRFFRGYRFLRWFAPLPSFRLSFSLFAPVNP